MNSQIQHHTLTGADLHVPGFIQSSDPGNVGAGCIWIDTSLGAGSWRTKVRNATDSGWDVVNGQRTIQMHADLHVAYSSSHYVKLIDMFRASIVFPSGITITSWYVDCSSDDPTTELKGDLKYCDGTTGAFPGANATLIDAVDTTAGQSSHTGMSTSIAAGKILYLEMDSDPTDTGVIWSLVVNFRVL